MPNNENAWSDWLDFNKETISKIPQSAGVYMMHVSMKILLLEVLKISKQVFKTKKKIHASQELQE